MDGFKVQADVRGPWRRFIDDLAPLRPELFRYCRGLTGSVWEGEDLAQDTLLRVFGYLGKINADLENPRAYLIRAATHLWIDRTRRQALERRHAESEGDMPSLAADDDPAQSFAVRDAASHLFLHLAPQERAAVLLKDVLDLSLEETAAMLRASVGTVKAALHRGRRKLKDVQVMPDTMSTTPREVVDRFVAALTSRDFDAIRDLCLADVTVDMVGGARFETYEKGKVTIEHAHMVIPALGMGTDPRWETREYHGEPIAIGLRTKNGVEGLNEVWRLEMGDGGVARIRLYCFTPDALAAVAADLGIACLRRPYRSPP